MAYIALDLGSSYTKMGVISSEGMQQEWQIATPPARPDPKRFEIDAQLYFECVLSLIEKAIRADTQGILISTQMHGYVLTDHEYRPVSPYVSWQDQMGAAYMEQIRQTLSAADVAPCGVPLKPNLALCAMLGRRFAGEAIPPKTLFHTLGGYIIARLTGKHACHLTNAAPTGLANIRQASWNADLLRKIALNELTMPAIVCDLQPVGEFRGIPVYPDLGDQQVCAAGAALTDESVFHINIGTAGLVGRLNTAFSAGAWETRPWLTQGKYLNTVTGLLGGRAVAALNQRLGGDRPDVWEMMTQHPTPEVAELYQRMAQEYLAASKRMQMTVRGLRFSGGCAAKNPALRAVIWDAFGLTPEENCVSSIWDGMVHICDTIC